MGSIDTWIRVAAFAIALVAIAAFARSILRLAMLNRHQRDPISLRVGVIVRALITRAARRRRALLDMQKTKAWALPVYIISLIATWFLLVQIAFTLAIWALEAETTWLKAFIASGSALSTLGFLTPPTVAGQLLAILEGAFGLGIVVFMFTFIPEYRSAVQSREALVGWLFARTGTNPTGLSLIEWCRRSGDLQDMGGHWGDWEGWFRDLAESHLLTPLLAFVPSTHQEKTWTGAATIVLDAASLFMSTLKVEGLEQAQVCHRMGVKAMHLIAHELAGADLDDSHDHNDSIAAAFDEAYGRWAASGVTLRGERDACRREFLALRSQYDRFVRQIALTTLTPIEDFSMEPLKPPGP
jgi:hypothetical protein